MAHTVSTPSTTVLPESANRQAEAGRPVSRMVRSMHWLDNRSPAGVCAVAAFLILCIGILSYITGPQLSSSLFYLIPVLLVTRVVGFPAGGLAALLAASIWLAADLNAGQSFGHPVTPYWNALMRLGTFLVAVSLVSAMRSLNAHLEERVLERTAALEAQIAETRELEKTILEISDRERAAIGQDLHDGLCQQLVSAAFTANLLREKIATDPAAVSIDADRIADMIDDSITQARNLARGLYPVRLETEGLEMAVRELASTLGQRFDIACTVECPSPLPPLKAGTGIHLYRIIQEAVTNAAKHARANQIVIHLSADPQHFLVRIKDDGMGIHRASRNPQGMGLSIMEYRARMIGADFQIESPPGGGTSVSCMVREEKLKAESWKLKAGS
jgi:signal transduction histidine kinase